MVDPLSYFSFQPVLFSIGDSSSYKENKSLLKAVDVML